MFWIGAGFVFLALPLVTWFLFGRKWYADASYEKKHGSKPWPAESKTVFQQIENENPALFRAIMANAIENGRRMQEEENKRN